jgi:hypothetical protein
MALESFSGIWSLNSSNPTSADDINQGDDHIRGIKASLRQTFPNISSTVNVSQTELNHLSGVGSNVQNALDTISASLATVTTNVATISGSLQAEITRADAHSANISTISTSLQSVISNVDTISTSLQQVISQNVVAYGGLTIGTPGTIFSASASAQAFLGWDAGMPTSGVTVTTAVGTMAPTVTGIYSVAFNFSFSGDASTKFNAVLYQDNAATDIAFSRLLGSPADIGAAGASGLISANASSVLAVRIVGTSGGDDFTPNFGQFHIHRISSSDA